MLIRKMTIANMLGSMFSHTNEEKKEAGYKDPNARRRHWMSKKVKKARKRVHHLSH